ncbi:MAG: hypothetical protein NZM94_14615, partial [Roseiflexus sp.]|nr:hypothetical protein [Roseiflexus sp.]
PHRAEIEAQMRYFPEGQLHIQTDKMAEIMLRCSWYFGAGGSITWERLYLKLTGLLVPTSKNQITFLEILHQKEQDILLEDLSLNAFKSSYTKLLERYINNIKCSSIKIESAYSKLNLFLG